MILVDTNVWSELTKRQRDPQVLDWLAKHEPDLRLSVIVIAEIRTGYELPRARQIRPMLELWLDGLIAAYSGRTEAFDTQDAQIYGQLAAQRTEGSNTLDLQLAAQAIARNIPIATRNVRDFVWTGVKLIDPWEA